jgi:CheY-like chemotaxis protein
VTTPRKLLVIDYNPDSGALLVRTLLRKFPRAVVQLVADAEAATSIVAHEKMAAVVAHRTNELNGVELIEYLRRLDPHVPILGVSGIDRRAALLAAGATDFMLYDEWLTVGTRVESLLTRPKPQTGPEPCNVGELPRVGAALPASA